MQKKHIQPGQKIALKLTAAQRRLVIDEVTCLGEIHSQIIEATPVDQPVIRRSADDARRTG